MKKTVLLLLLLLLLLCSVYPICAEDELPEEPGIRVSDEIVRVVNANLENLFPISSRIEKFTTPQKPVFYEFGIDAFMRTRIESGKKYMVTVANPDGVHDIIGMEQVTEGHYANFQLSMEIRVNDAYPKDQAGCFIGFTNKDLLPSAAEANEEMILLYTNGNGADAYVKKEGELSGKKLGLGAGAGSNAKLSIIHLTGTTFFYVNGVFVGQYYDGFAGPFVMLYGSAVFSGGDIADCTFDNLQIRKVEQ